MTKENLSSIRRDFGKSQLHEDVAPADPLVLFEAWLNDAIREGLPEPTAMSLSTVSASGKPSSRIVLLKDCDELGFVFYSNYESRKGLQIRSNPYAALLFFWPELERQVRIEGRIERTTADMSDQYFNERPLESRIGAIISPQSHQVPDRDFLTSEFDKLLKESSGNELKRPEYWGGYRLIPEYFEFWQGGKYRLHDRLIYELSKEGWKTYRLAP